MGVSRDDGTKLKSFKSDASLIPSSQPSFHSCAFFLPSPLLQSFPPQTHLQSFPPQTHLQSLLPQTLLQSFPPQSFPPQSFLPQSFPTQTHLRRLHCQTLPLLPKLPFQERNISSQAFCTLLWLSFPSFRIPFLSSLPLPLLPPIPLPFLSIPPSWREPFSFPPFSCVPSFPLPLLLPIPIPFPFPIPFSFLPFSCVPSLPLLLPLLSIPPSWHEPFSFPPFSCVLSLPLLLPLPLPPLLCACVLSSFQPPSSPPSFSPPLSLPSWHQLRRGWAKRPLLQGSKQQQRWAGLRASHSPLQLNFLQGWIPQQQHWSQAPLHQQGWAQQPKERLRGQPRHGGAHRGQALQPKGRQQCSRSFSQIKLYKTFY